MNKYEDVQAFLSHDVWFDPSINELGTSGTTQASDAQASLEGGRACRGYRLQDHEKKVQVALVGRCDSFVAETGVCHPPDFSLLRDLVRCLIRLASRYRDAFGIRGCRQQRHLEGMTKALFHRVNTAHRRGFRPKEVRAYPDTSLGLTDKAKSLLKALEASGCPRRGLDETS